MPKLAGEGDRPSNLLPLPLRFFCFITVCTTVYKKEYAFTLPVFDQRGLINLARVPIRTRGGRRDALATQFNAN